MSVSNNPTVEQTDSVKKKNGSSGKLLAVLIGLMLIVNVIYLSFPDVKTEYACQGFPSAQTPSIWLEYQEAMGFRKFYSQFGQDKWILGDVFSSVSDGFFVDIGAAHAEIHSNTKALEDAGWNGICIEPFPTGPWETRKAQLFKEIVYSKAGEEVEFRTAGALGGIDDHIDHWKDHVKNEKLVVLTTTTIEELLVRAKAPNFIHYLSLDTEGSEFEILSAFPFSQYRIGALTIEHNGEEEKRGQIRTLLESNGYRFVKQHVVEDWYVYEG